MEDGIMLSVQDGVPAPLRAAYSLTVLLAATVIVVDIDEVQPMRLVAVVTTSILSVSVTSAASVEL